MAGRLADLVPPQRLAIGLFLLLILGFYALAQVKLVTSGGGSGYPGPKAVLLKYHGDRRKSRLHVVLDPALPAEHPIAMYPYLAPGDDARAEERRGLLLGWVERGTPASGWSEVAPVLQDEETCGQCHSARPGPGGEPRAKADVPFDTLDETLAAVRADTGMSLHDLSTSAHNHLMGFAVVSLLVSLVFSFTRWRGAAAGLPVALAFVGPAVDVSSWWLTRAHGSPFEWGVIVGGALFGASVTWMTVLSLDELWLRGVLGRVLARAGNAVARRPGRGAAGT